MAKQKNNGLPSRAKDKTGQTFGKLLVLRFMGLDKRHQSLWECQCVCGNLKIVRGECLSSGNVAVCCHSCALTIHGHTIEGSVAPEFQTWKNMLARCKSTRKRDRIYYLDRGITICERWKASFANFLADMGGRQSALHSIDRIDNNGNYEPGNCRWATAAQQSDNRGITKLFTLGNESRTATDWARKIGIGRSAMIKRLRKWPLERALTDPPHC